MYSLLIEAFPLVSFCIYIYITVKVLAFISQKHLLNCWKQQILTLSIKMNKIDGHVILIAADPHVNKMLYIFYSIQLGLIKL